MLSIAPSLPLPIQLSWLASGHASRTKGRGKFSPLDGPRQQSRSERFRFAALVAFWPCRRQTLSEWEQFRLKRLLIPVPFPIIQALRLRNTYLISQASHVSFFQATASLAFSSSSCLSHGLASRSPFAISSSPPAGAIAAKHAFSALSAPSSQFLILNSPVD